VSRLAAAVLTILAFALNWAWEEAGCRPFFVHSEPAHGRLAMARAAVGDVAMTWIGYAVIAAASRRWDWIGRPWSRRQWAALAVVATAMSIAVERIALASGRWSYTPVNPVLPGVAVSVIPILQLLLLLPLAFAGTRAVVRRANGALGGLRAAPPARVSSPRRGGGRC
jgi:hypothetical protein